MKKALQYTFRFLVVVFTAMILAAFLGDVLAPKEGPDSTSTRILLVGMAVSIAMAIAIMFPVRVFNYVKTNIFGLKKILLLVFTSVVWVSFIGHPVEDATMSDNMLLILTLIGMILFPTLAVIVIFPVRVFNYLKSKRALIKKLGKVVVGLLAATFVGVFWVTLMFYFFLIELDSATEEPSGFFEFIGVMLISLPIASVLIAPLVFPIGGAAYAVMNYLKLRERKHYLCLGLIMPFITTYIGLEEYDSYQEQVVHAYMSTTGLLSALIPSILASITFWYVVVREREAS